MNGGVTYLDMERRKAAAATVEQLAQALREIRDSASVYQHNPHAVLLRIEEIAKGALDHAR